MCISYKASMDCPFCGGGMEQGFVQSTGSIFWSRKKRKAYPAAHEADGDVVLSYRNWLSNFTDFAYICRACDKVIINVRDMDGDEQ